MEIKAEDKFSKALEFQAEGKTRHEIYKLLGYASLDSLTKLMKKNGYKFSDQHQQYIHTESNTLSITHLNNTESNTLSITLQPQQEQLLSLLDDYETLQKMIDWFKKFNNTDASPGLKIELPQSENTMITIRGNKEIWEAFGEFAKQNNSFTKGDLLSQALKDFMDKHKKNEP